ncbi:unnamed protein product [Schistosoma margrebowiei]|uniref:Uncharacterized protein n=1 Tax=Schistosoma margrebowiei TaxID=48269 RepID=A0AA85AHI3_9TREM|nr:unnamed protein product [Schistosoma margrebowiei]
MNDDVVVVGVDGGRIGCGVRGGGGGGVRGVSVCVAIVVMNDDVVVVGVDGGRIGCGVRGGGGGGGVRGVSGVKVVL